MSTDTRERILRAARALLRSGGAAAVTMAAVGRDADVSRQAVYLHFADRAALLVALVDDADREAELAEHYQRVLDAPTAAKAIEAWALMQVERNPRIAPLARALDTERHADSAASAAWHDRMKNRRRGAEGVVARLAAEGLLHSSWSREHAAIFLAELTSFHVWDDLVTDAGVDPGLYVRMIVTAALATFAAPLRRK